MACERFLLNIKLHGQLINNMTENGGLTPPSPITASILPLLLPLLSTCFGMHLTLNLPAVILYSKTLIIFADTAFQNSELY